MLPHSHWLLKLHMPCWLNELKSSQEKQFLFGGAGSGVGSMAIQIAHYFGCTVYAAAGTDEKVNMAIKIGCRKSLELQKYRYRIDD